MKNTSIEMGCEKMDNKNNNQDSLDVAGRNFEVEDYKREDTLSSRLAKHMNKYQILFHGR